MRTILLPALALASGCSLIFDADDRVGTPVDAGRDARTVDAPMIDAGPPDAPADAPTIEDAGPVDAGPPCDLRAPWYTGAPDGRMLCETAPMIPALTTTISGRYSPWLTVAVPERNPAIRPLVMIGLLADVSGTGAQSLLGHTPLGDAPALPVPFETGAGGAMTGVDSFDLRVQSECEVGWVSQGNPAAGESGIRFGVAEACTMVGLTSRTAPMGATAQPIAAVSRSADSAVAFWSDTTGNVIAQSNAMGSTPVTIPGIARGTFARVVGTIEPRAIVDSTASEVVWLRPDDDAMSTIVIGTNRGDLGFATLDADDDLDVVAWFTESSDRLELRALGTSASCPEPAIADQTLTSTPPAPFDVASMPGGGIVVARAGSGDVELRFYDRRLVPVAIGVSPAIDVALSGVGVVSAVSVDTVLVGTESTVVVGFLEILSSTMARYGYFAVPISSC